MLSVFPAGNVFAKGFKGTNDEALCSGVLLAEWQHTRPSPW